MNVRRPRSVEDLREAAWAALDDDPADALRLAREALTLADDGEGHYLYAVTLLENGD